MALTADQRERGWRWLVDHRGDTGPVPWTKPQLRAAADAAETWVTANQASYAATKVRLLIAALIAKYEVDV